MLYRLQTCAPGRCLRHGHPVDGISLRYHAVPTGRTRHVCTPRCIADDDWFVVEPPVKRQRPGALALAAVADKPATQNTTLAGAVVSAVPAGSAVPPVQQLSPQVCVEQQVATGHGPETDQERAAVAAAMAAAAVAGVLRRAEAEYAAAMEVAAGGVDQEACQPSLKRAHSQQCQGHQSQQQQQQQQQQQDYATSEQQPGAKRLRRWLSQLLQHKEGEGEERSQLLEQHRASSAAKRHQSAARQCTSTVTAAVTASGAPGRRPAWGTAASGWCMVKTERADASLHWTGSSASQPAGAGSDRGATRLHCGGSAVGAVKQEPAELPPAAAAAAGAALQQDLPTELAAPVKLKDGVASAAWQDAPEAAGVPSTAVAAAPPALGHGPELPAPAAGAAAVAAAAAQGTLRPEAKQASSGECCAAVTGHGAAEQEQQHQPEHHQQLQQKSQAQEQYKPRVEDLLVMYRKGSGAHAGAVQEPASSCQPSPPPQHPCLGCVSRRSSGWATSGGPCACLSH